HGGFAGGRAAVPRLRHPVENGLRRRERLAGARHAEAVRHHDEQATLVQEEELLPEKARVRLRLRPERGNRAEVERLADDRDPDRKAELLRVDEQLVQLVGLLLRDVRVEREKGVLREEEVA